MKKIDQIREQYDLITEKEEAETRKLTTLVRAGLFDPKKLPMLKRALGKDPKDMTTAERKILIELLDSLMGEVLQSQQVYSKVKQNIMMKEETVEEAKTFDGYYSKYDPRYTKMPSEREIPVVIILKRKAIRVYPDNQKVALYYSQALDKYVTIPFGTFEGGGINEATKPGKPNDEEKHQQLMKRISAAQALRDKTAAQKEKVDSLTTTVPSGVEKTKKEVEAQKTGKKPFDNKEKITKKRRKDLYDRELTSKMDIGRANVTMKNDPDISFGTRKAIIAGLAARRAWEGSKAKQLYNKVKSSYKIAKNQAKNINTTFEESETRSKFYEKRQKQKIDEQALPKSDVEIKTYKPTTDYKPSEKPANVNKPLEKGKSVVPSVKGKEIELPSAVKGAVAGRKFGLPGMVAGAVLSPDKAGEKPEELPVAKNVAKTIKQIQGLEGQQRFRPAPDSNKEVSFEKPQKPVEIPTPTPTPVKPEPATKPSAPESKPAVDTSKLPEVSQRDILDDLTSVLGMTSAAKGIQSLRNRKGGSKKGDRDLPDVSLPDIKLPSLEIDKSYTPPKDFSLKAKLSKPKGNVRTGVEARDAAQYRKAMQQNESVLNTLYSIKENEEKAIKVANESVVINNTVAKKIIGLYESVNRSNKEKIETMLNESVDSFKKIASFAARQ